MAQQTMGGVIAKPPDVITINLASDSFAHLLNVLDGMVANFGAVQGRPVGVSINPRVQPLVDALYQVLAGGQVTVLSSGDLHITPGTPGYVTDLKNMENACLTSINRINGAAGFELVLPV